MFDPRPDLGRPDCGIVSALTADAAASSLEPDFAFVIEGARGRVALGADFQSVVDQIERERREMERLRPEFQRVTSRVALPPLTNRQIASLIQARVSDFQSSPIRTGEEPKLLPAYQPQEDRPSAPGVRK